MTPHLIAVLLLDKGRSVRCQHNGCDHLIDTEACVIQHGLRYLIVGADCYQKYYAHITGTYTPAISNGSTPGILLTEALHELLESSIDALLNELRARFPSTGTRSAITHTHNGLTVTFVRSGSRYRPVNVTGTQHFQKADARKVCIRFIMHFYEHKLNINSTKTGYFTTLSRDIDALETLVTLAKDNT